MVKISHLLNRGQKPSMKNDCVKLLLIVVAVIVVIAVVAVMYKMKTVSTDIPDIPLEVSNAPLTDRSFLTASGADIVDRDGNTVLLCGVNLGGWLLQEYWMCPVNGEPKIEKWTEHQTVEVLEERFGREKTEALFETYRDNWITEWDLKNIASIGCNTVRVPFWYRNFMYDDGTWIYENPDNNPGFKRLDWVIETAGKYGLYVVLDMHGCPGGQSTDHCTGLYNTMKLYSEEKYADMMEELWLAISERYRNEPVVAAYDIMNEPLSGYSGDARKNPVTLIYDRMYKAIRKVGDEHIIMMEAIWDFPMLPYPETMGWENCVYEVHWYGSLDPLDCARRASEYANSHSVPVYMGEFNNYGLYGACKKYGISCTAWTYKGIMDYPEWFMFSPHEHGIMRADIYNDSYEDIMEKWGAALDTRYFSENNAATVFFRNRK